jgi:hypothetical protein|tara:strand:+ start:160 stop:396 length:237 start_codon:yes stop_codon:yes gene_type:complete
MVCKTLYGDVMGLGMIGAAIMIGAVLSAVALTGAIFYVPRLLGDSPTVAVAARAGAFIVVAILCGGALRRRCLAQRSS